MNNKKGISNYDIDYLLRNIDLYNGCYSNDNLPKLKNGFYVVNLQDEKDNGSHWVCFCKNDIKNIYYDPFGCPPSDEVHSKLYPYLYSNKDIQNIDSTNCGYYCIAFIKWMNMNLLNPIKRFDEFICNFDLKNTNKNDKTLKYMLSYLYKTK